MKKRSPFLARAAGAIAALVLALGASPVSAADYSTTVLSDGPVAYYRFSDGVTAPVTDQAINLGSLGAAANGNYNNALHPVPGALVGSAATAARVSGGQNVSIPYNAGLNTGSAFAVEGWFRPAAANTGGTLTCAISSVQVASPRSGWLIYQSATGWNFRTYNQNGTATAVNITGGGVPVVGQWYHVVAVWDGTVGRLFVNGALVATSPATTFVANPNTPFAIGMRSDAAFVWAGDADEVAYYDFITPSAAQIAAHYANGISAAPSPSYDQVVLADSPAAYWRLNEGTFVPPVAANSGSLGNAANGGYLGGATDGNEAPRAPQFIGFEPDNTALNLDGVNDFVKTIPGLLNGKPAFTLSGWIRRGADQANRTGIWGQNDIVEFGYINNSTLEVWTDNGLDIPNAIPNGEWAHLAIVSDGSPGTMTLYTNGVSAGSRAHILPADNTFAFNIGGGGIFDGAGNFFNGQMDEVAVFDKALSAERICSQYYTAIPNVPPFISRQPVATNVFEGDTIRLSAFACGSGTVRYQWVFDFNVIPDATNSSLVINDAPVSASGDYWLVVENDYGMLVSDVVNVQVAPPPAPVITAQPQSITRYAGGKAVFRVEATGGSRIRYQWQKNGTDLAGETNAILMIAGVQANDADNYRVMVRNAGGTTPSDVVTLTVISAAAGYETEVVSGNPLAYWRLGETSGTVAHDYWGGNDGTYFNVTLGANGAILDGDKAAEFDGSSSYVGTSLSLNDVSAFTMVGWIRRNADQADRTGLFGQNDLVEFGYINNNTLEVWTDNGLDISPNSIPNEEWAQVAIVSDGSPGTITMYTNAEPAGSRGHVLPGTNGFKFNIGGGGIFDAAGNFFNGRIDDLAVYGRALSQAEICNLFVTGSGRYAKPCCNDEPTYTLLAASTASDEDSGPVTVPAWLSNVSPGPDEANQTVTLHLSNNNPALFSAQPAIDAAGTLSYTPAPDANGSAIVTLYLTDDGGTGVCGDDTSATNAFMIVIRPMNDCPVAYGTNLNLVQDSSIDFHLAGRDVDGDSLSYEITVYPTHGVLGIATQTGAGTYLPNADYCGPDSFTYRVYDGTCRSPEVTVSITVQCANKCPIAQAIVSPSCVITGSTTMFILAGQDDTGCVILDGRASTDADGNPLTYSWFADGGLLPIAVGALTTNCFPIGEHVVTLMVDDGTCFGSTNVHFEVVTACDMVENLIQDINNSSLPRNKKRPLIDNLKKICKIFEKDKKNEFRYAVKKLESFQKKLKGELKRHPVQQAQFNASAQAIIDAIRCAVSLQKKKHHDHD